MADQLEDIESFRLRARGWLVANMERRSPDSMPQFFDQESLEGTRSLQRKIFEDGFAGITMPTEYGGQGLTVDHQKAFGEEAAGYVMPPNSTPTLVYAAPTLIEHGSEVLKKRHLPAMLRGDELWMPLLSEPRGGSDLAGAITRATRDGDTWVVSGQKTWSTFAAIADYGLLLARTNWDVPKHQGLSMFAMPLKISGVTIKAIKNADGTPFEFFNVFFDDAVIPHENLIGDENNGWVVAQTVLLHERNAAGGIGHSAGLRIQQQGVEDLISAAKARGVDGDPVIGQLIAEAYIDQVVRNHASRRVMAGIRSGKMKGHWGSLLKLGGAVAGLRRAEIALAVTGADGVTWTYGAQHAGSAGRNWLLARAGGMAGGTNEIQRNIVSERLLGLPREPVYDRDIPFRDVPRGR